MLYRGISPDCAMMNRSAGSFIEAMSPLEGLFLSAKYPRKYRTGIPLSPGAFSIS